MANDNMFWDSWKDLLNKPREDVDTFCAGLFYYHALEKSKQNGTSLIHSKIGDYTVLSLDCDISSPKDLIKCHIQDKLLIFIYESIEAGFIQNKTTKFINGEAFSECFNAYTSLFKGQTPNMEFPIPTRKYTKDEATQIIENYIDAKGDIQGYINPTEVVAYLYSSAGKEFLPPSLIAYYEKKNGITQKKPTSIGNNRSGSRINPEKHAITREACRQAWDKVQKDRKPSLNLTKFENIVTEYLNKGESIISTVIRKFYKEEVTQEYKAGAGRRGK